MNHQGVIALDIDGTLSHQGKPVEERLTRGLKTLHEKGWIIYLVTGRTFAFSQLAISHLDFPYFLALQNGADILKMPEKKQMHQTYVDDAFIKTLDRIYAKYPEDYLIYSGHALGDLCYYRGENMSEVGHKYIKELKALTSTHCQNVADFTHFNQKQFPLFKCFGQRREMIALEEELLELPDISPVRIRDVVDRSYDLVMIAHKGVDKGGALRLLGKDGPFIAAGDDRNDIPMLKKADFGISVGEGLKEYADVCCKPEELLDMLLKGTNQCKNG
ncbi:MAG: Cof-type HAD-IIB family hydrolase [Simkaniaceae bacterium]|nr:Cof-type HAD-IIB family hydrolase [Simkaniaceae bacterium]